MHTRHAQEVGMQAILQDRLQTAHIRLVAIEVIKQIRLCTKEVAGTRIQPQVIQLGSVSVAGTAATTAVGIGGGV